jgi:hypothetical protein
MRDLRHVFRVQPPDSILLAGRNQAFQAEVPQRLWDEEPNPEPPIRLAADEGELDQPLQSIEDFKRRATGSRNGLNQ